MRHSLCILFLLAPAFSCAADQLPEAPLAFVQRNCLDCHDAETQEGDVNLDVQTVDWRRQDNRLLWERVLDALTSGSMPPKDHDQPSIDERATIVAWIDDMMISNAPIGGTLPRRLNQVEYKATIESIFNLKNFSLPEGFPADRELHGFDNLGEGLVLSPPLLDAYAETARRVADEIFPPRRPASGPVTYRAAAEDLIISYSSSKVVDGAMRLGMKCDAIHRSCTWPSRIEASVSGIYTVTVRLSTFRPKGDKSMIAKIFARDVASNDGVSHKSLRLLKEIEVNNESPEVFMFDTTLFEGQTIVLHWANATLDSDRGDRAELQQFFRKKNEENPRYLDAWHAMVTGEKGQGFRGGIGWERVKMQLGRSDLPEISAKQEEALLKKIAGNPVLYAETVVFDVFENGPALEIHDLSLEGPHRVVDGPHDLERQKVQSRFLGNHTHPEDTIRSFLTRAFRRPADVSTVKHWLHLYEQHIALNHSPEQAMHLVIRTALISPRFLYRCLQDGPLDGFDLATRLSYFLTGRPADEALLKKVGRLSEQGALRSQAERLLPSRASSPMIVNFTGQWLDTRLLSEIMPDPKFNFSVGDEKSASSEVEYFFYEMLKENRPMKDFIDPNFTWTSARMAENVYGLKDGFDKKKANVVHRISLPRGGRIGGVLGQSAVMMVTANGVDTQPVLRGVWVLENILGAPPPPPPKGVPPITPDTTGAKTPRELLSLHTSETSCAGCHRKIDPVGFVLENFDPVGRWRDNWPEIDVPINASATLADGTEIRDIVDFKAWLVENIDQFSECLAEKLMTYATGRVPNYSERKEINAIVEANQRAGMGFRDLLLALIESKTFRTK